MAEHSFQVPMPNSSLLLNYLRFDERFLQESRLITEVFILEFCLCAVAMATRLVIKQGLNNGFVHLKNTVVRFFSSFAH